MDEEFAQTCTPRYTEAQYIQGINRQIGFLCLFTTQKMFLQIQSTIIFNKELNRGTATIKLGFCSLVTFFKAQRKLYFSHNLPKTPTISLQSIWQMCSMCVQRRKQNISNTLAYISQEVKWRTDTWKALFWQYVHLKSKIFHWLLFQSLRSDIPQLHEKWKLKKKKDKFKPQTRLWNQGSVNKHSRDDFTYS